MTNEPPRGDGGAPSGSPYPPPDNPYQQPGQQPQPYVQQQPDQGYDYQPPPQPAYLQPGQPQQPPQQSPYAPQQAPSPYQPAPQQQPLPLPPPPMQPGPAERHNPAFDGPLPEAPADNPPLQWGAPLSAAAPAPKAAGPAPLSKLAIVALVIGALAGVPPLVAVLLEKDPGRWVLLGSLGGATALALLLGLISLIRCRGGRRRGAPLAVAGMVLAALWGAGSAYAVLQNSAPEARDAAGKIVRKGEVDVTSLKVGDCLEKLTAANQVGKVTGLPCTTNHEAEVFHTFTAAGDDKFPGEAEVTKEANAQCVEKAKTLLKPDDAKKAKVAFLKPVEAGWKKGQKQVTCVAVMPAALGRSIRK
jgi:hypothetical protein